MNRLWRLVLVLLVLYLADWKLTLLGVQNGGVELHPLAGQWWNAGDSARPLALKLLGVALLLALPLAVAGGRRRRRAAEALTASALVLFLAVDVASVLQLAHA